MDDTLLLLYDTGFTKSINDLTISDQPSIVQSLVDYHLMIKVKAQMDQFKDGLKALGFLSMLTSKPSEWERYFIVPERKVTAGRYIRVSYVVRLL